MSKNKDRDKYHSHRSNAKKVGKEFLLTFEEWLKIWVDSGHYHERGHYKGQYVMARYGDKGPYAVGNVKIITFEENSREHVGNRPETVAKIVAVHTGRKRSDITKARLRAAWEKRRLKPGFQESVIRHCAMMRSRRGGEI